ncbi:hypothetical protein [Actinomadura sp. K4S16]|uniref:hypothetical protein n=1 Tax=Actinomadura sp. K4S16 TaxID=1316147 RepID=UPI0011EFF876|nr:hypothetical protein [Actinomadura sp. K4S16]
MTYDHTQVGRNPQTEYETEQFAEDLERAARSLSRAVGQPSGLASPATVYAVLDAVHAATSGLDSLLVQLERFLVRQHADGHLIHDYGAPLDETLDDFGRAVLHARHLGAGCGEALDQARAAINHVHSRVLPPGDGVTPPHAAAEPAPTAVLRRAEPRARQPESGRPRARWFGNSRKGAGA